MRRELQNEIDPMTRLQQIRHECLLQLYGSKEIPLCAAHIRKVALRQGLDYSDQEVRNALFFLRGQGFCEMIVLEATGEVRHRITSLGMLEWEHHANLNPDPAAPRPES